MSARELREAAAQILHDYEGGTDTTSRGWLAVGAWLEAVAERQEPTAHWRRRSHGWTGSREANAVARAYMGRRTGQ